MKNISTLLIAFMILPGLANAATCKIKTLGYTDGWLSNETKQAIAHKGYKLMAENEAGTVDYKLTYELKTYGIYPCGIRLFTCVGDKRFATFTLQKENSSDKPLIQIEESSKKKEFSVLRESIDQKVIQQIESKLPSCEA